MIDVRLVDSQCYPRWRQQIRSDPGVSNGLSQLGHLQTFIIHQETTSATLGTMAVNYFRFADAILKNCQNRLGQPEKIEIRRENMSTTRGTALECPFSKQEKRYSRINVTTCMERQGRHKN